MTAMQTTRSALFFVFCATLLTLSGCAQGAFDPFQRPNQWSATNAANQNLAQQVYNKSDLVQGESESGALGIAAVAGVEKATTDGTAKGLQTAATPVSLGTGN